MIDETEIIELDARRQAIVNMESFAMATEDGGVMSIICTAKMNDAYAPYLKALYAEIEALKAENERLRNALQRAVNDVEMHCDKSDEPEWTQQAREALGND